MLHARQVLYLTLTMILASSGSLANEKPTSEPDDPVNRVEISELLTTSGQPKAAYFEQLAAEGYEMVVNLAPPQSHGSLENEGGLVATKNMIYVNIPVDWDDPSPAHLAFFIDLLRQNSSRKTLVHCQVGYRASTFTFLYRVVAAKHAPDEALEKVHAAWVPNDTWAKFANTALQDNGIDFQVDAP